MDPSTYRPFSAGTAAEILAGFDHEVDVARRAVFRDMTLSHLVHRLGQLSVYPRLLEIPVPESYGPTADSVR